MHQLNGPWANERQTSLCLKAQTRLSLFLWPFYSLITQPLLAMRSPALSTLFLTLFALLFGVVFAAPVASPNVSIERDCISASCSNAVPTQPDNGALVKKCFYDVRSAFSHCKTPPVPSEPPAPSPSPSLSASSSTSVASTTDVPQPSPSPIRWFTEIAIPVKHGAIS
jgi:hypothetical protein